MNQAKGGAEEDLLAPQLDDETSPMILHGKQMYGGDGSRPNLPNEMNSEKMFFSKRQHSKTVHHEQRKPLLSYVKPGANSRAGLSEEKLR